VRCVAAPQVISAEPDDPRGGARKKNRFADGVPSTKRAQGLWRGSVSIKGRCTQTLLSATKVRAPTRVAHSNTGGQYSVV